MTSIDVHDFECSAVTSGCEIELTNHCTLDCFGCVRKSSLEYGFLKIETLEKILKIIQDKQYKEIVLSGLGDVFLHPDLYEIIDHIFKAFPRVHIYIMTKGQSITEYDIDTLNLYKKRGYNISITYSIFSLQAATYHDVTGGGDLNYLLKMILYSHKVKVSFNFEFFLDNANIGYREKFKRFAFVFGKSFHYSIPHNWGGKLPNDIYQKLFNLEILQGIVSHRKRGDICEAFSGDYLFFDYAGNIYKCGMKRWQKDLFLGDVDIPNISKKLQYSNCKDCSYFSYKTYTG